MEEIWKPIKNCDDYYVSNFGRVLKNNYKSRKKANNKKVIVKSLKHTKEDNCYLTVSIRENGKKHRHFYIHRLVADTFLNNKYNLPCVNHKNGIKTDNRVENLEWCSYSDNMKHALKTGLIKRRYAEDNKESKEYVELDKNYDYIRTFIGARQENIKLGYCIDSIQKVARGVILSTHNKIYLEKKDYYENDKQKTINNHKEKHKKYKK